MLELLRSFPHTTIVTCTRGASALVNSLAAKVLFHDRHKNPLGVIPMDYDANEANFEAHGRLQKGALEPSCTEIFEGERIFLTRNIDKGNDFVNGMPAVVENYDSTSMCLHVTTVTGKPLAVHLCTEDIEQHGRVTSFPVRLGYAWHTSRRYREPPCATLPFGWTGRSAGLPPTSPCPAWSAMRTTWWRGVCFRSTSSCAVKWPACRKTASLSAEQLSHGI